jgi:hypothetical protein
MTQTKTQKLAGKLAEIAENHATEIAELEYRGPRGGQNAKTIPGWSRSTNNITRAAGLIQGFPRMNWWDGSAPTPSTGIPTCCAAEAYAAEKNIFPNA